MSNIEYPTREWLEWWIQYLSGSNNSVRLALPVIDDRWYTCVLDTVQRIQNPYYPSDVHVLAAHLFYNINKAHNFPDGNKRSSILIVYLFYLINDYLVVSRSNLRKMAKEVARSKGRSRHDQWIAKIENCFKKNTVKFVEAE